MENIKEFYILGEPIDTEIGKLHPTTVRDYAKLIRFYEIIAFDKKDLIIFLKDLVKTNAELQPLLDLANALTLFDFMYMFRGEEYQGSFPYDMYYQYEELFGFCFQEDVFHKVQSSKDFEYYIQLIRQVNDIQYEKPSSNPEIARFDRLKQQLQAAKGELITFEAMYTSVLLSSGVHPNDMTIYQFNRAFDRIMHFKQYDTTSLFATVSSDVEIVPWYGTTKEKEATVITEEQLNRAKQQLASGGLQSSL